MWTTKTFNVTEREYMKLCAKKGLDHRVPSAVTMTEREYEKILRDREREQEREYKAQIKAQAAAEKADIKQELEQAKQSYEDRCEAREVLKNKFIDMDIDQ